MNKYFLSLIDFIRNFESWGIDYRFQGCVNVIFSILILYIMGSGIKRKQIDQPFIKTPLSKIGGFRGQEILDEASEICISSFDVKIQRTDLTVTGVVVSLEVKNDQYFIMIAGSVIGKLSSVAAKMVEKCKSFGVLYKGFINEKNGSTYVRFIRLASQ